MDTQLNQSLSSACVSGPKIEPYIGEAHVSVFKDPVCANTPAYINILDHCMLNIIGTAMSPIGVSMVLTAVW